MAMFVSCILKIPNSGSDFNPQANKFTCLLSRLRKRPMITIYSGIKQNDLSIVRKCLQSNKNLGTIIAYTRTRACVHAHSCMRTRALVHAYTRTRACVHAHSCMRTRALVHAYTRTRACVHAHSCMRTRALVHAYTRTRACVHAHSCMRTRALVICFLADFVRS